ncbi:MAG: methylated-DNA--[protein]-cysteine S-methyltransferase [Cyanobacteria bacterium P01_D01_bin.156]
MALSSKALAITKIESPIGEILLVTDEDTLVSLDYEGYEHRMMRLLEKRYGAFTLTETSNSSERSASIEHIVTALQRYLAGELTAIDTIQVDPGGTKFQSTVWHTLRSIPPGTVMSYGSLAQYLGNPNAVRAVGTTNSLNPISIVLPCHRVIGANGNLTGYAGGLERKRWLLQHEGIDTTNLKQQGKHQQLSLLDLE